VHPERPVTCVLFVWAALTMNGVEIVFEEAPHVTDTLFTVMSISLLKFVTYTHTVLVGLFPRLENSLIFPAWQAALVCIPAVCVLVNVVNQSERIAPTATVKPIKRTAATKELIPFFIVIT